MKEPIKSGDNALVVGGLGRHKSPNLGLTVTVGQCLGEHSQHGRIWHCTGEGIKQLTDSGEYVVTHAGDFAQSWLQKIEPPALPDKSKAEEIAF
jgi:hypothetical protein